MEERLYSGCDNWLEHDPLKEIFTEIIYFLEHSNGVIFGIMDIQETSKREKKEKTQRKIY